MSRTVLETEKKSYVGWGQHLKDGIFLNFHINLGEESMFKIDFILSLQDLIIEFY